jgi:hypothetical protein
MTQITDYRISRIRQLRDLTADDEAKMSAADNAVCTREATIEGYTRCSRCSKRTSSLKLRAQLQLTNIISGESGAAGLACLYALMRSPKALQWRETLGLHENSSVLVFSTEGVTDPLAYEAIVQQQIGVAPAISHR